MELQTMHPKKKKGAIIQGNNSRSSWNSIPEMKGYCKSGPSLQFPDINFENNKHE